MARRQAAALAVVLGATLGADVVATGALSGVVFGTGWAWPSPPHLAAVVLGALAHPAHPSQGWPAGLARRLPGAGAFWAVFAAVAGIETAAVVLVGRRSVAGPHPPGTAAPTGLARRSPVSDQRSRFGFASPAQLRLEASVSAARRRAPQTRPSLAGGGQRLSPSDVGYPLGYAVPGGMALWPSWEASLRLVAPPGEGKTFRGPGAHLAPAPRAGSGHVDQGRSL